MAWSTGEACGLTLTRSSRPRWANHSAVMMETSEALEAWWPPTLTPSPVLRVVVGGVDDADREPEHAPLDRRQHVQVHGRARGHGGPGTQIQLSHVPPPRRSSDGASSIPRIAAPGQAGSRRPPAAVPPFRSTERDLATVSPAAGASSVDHPSRGTCPPRSRTGPRRRSRSSRSKTPMRSCPGTRKSRSRRTIRPSRWTGWSAEPMDRIDPVEPMDRMDPFAPMDRIELPSPPGPGEPPVAMITLWHPHPHRHSTRPGRPLDRAGGPCGDQGRPGGSSKGDWAGGSSQGARGRGRRRSQSRNDRRGGRGGRAVMLPLPILPDTSIRNVAGTSAPQGALTVTVPLRTDTSSVSTTMPGFVSSRSDPLCTSASICRVGQVTCA